MEILPNEVYTSEEVENLLKVSKSTVKRLLKKGLLRANKIGKQYRFLGHEILRLVSPNLDVTVSNKYGNFKRKVIKKVESW